MMVYLIGSVGMTFCMHICQGRIVDIAINTPEEKHKSCCSDKEKSEKACCKEIKVLAKTDPVNSFLIKDLIPLQAVLVKQVLPEYFFITPADVKINILGLPQPPPGIWQDIPLYLLYSSRKIFG